MASERCDDAHNLDAEPRPVSEYRGVTGLTFRESYGNRYDHARCPECHGMVIGFGHYSLRYPHWPIFRCSGGHALNFTHGYVLRVPCYDRPAAARLEGIVTPTPPRAGGPEAGD